MEWTQSEQIDSVGGMTLWSPCWNQEVMHLFHLTGRIECDIIDIRLPAFCPFVFSLYFASSMFNTVFIWCSQSLSYQGAQMWFVTIRHTLQRLLPRSWQENLQRDKDRGTCVGEVQGLNQMRRETRAQIIVLADACVVLTEITNYSLEHWSLGRVPINDLVT